MDKIKPLHDRLIVKRVDASLTSQGGILIPEVAKEKPQEGIVVAVGRGKMLETGQLKPMEVSAGDQILFGKFAGVEIKLDGEDMLILREEDVLAVVQKTK